MSFSGVFRIIASSSLIPVNWTMTRMRLETAVTIVPMCTTQHKLTPTTMVKGTPALWTLMGMVSSSAWGWSVALLILVTQIRVRGHKCVRTLCTQVHSHKPANHRALTKKSHLMSVYRLKVYLCVSEAMWRGRVLPCACGSQKTTFRSWFSSPS